MTLGERCDEILRLIDETLADVAAAERPAPPARRRRVVLDDPVPVLR